MRRIRSLAVVASAIALVAGLPGPSALAGGNNWAWVTARIARPRRDREDGLLLAEQYHCLVRP